MYYPQTKEMRKFDKNIPWQRDNMISLFMGVLALPET